MNIDPESFGSSLFSIAWDIQAAKDIERQRRLTNANSQSITQDLGAATLGHAAENQSGVIASTAVVYTETDLRTDQIDEEIFNRAAAAKEHLRQLSEKYMGRYVHVEDVSGTNSYIFRRTNLDRVNARGKYYGSKIGRIYNNSFINLESGILQLQDPSFFKRINDTDILQVLLIAPDNIYPPVSLELTDKKKKRR